ncbi:hypothetical protein STEG23_006259 [Scotinomys teguina]
MPSTEEWIRNMWYIYTMEYYAAEKNNDIMKFAGKWMELENVILSKGHTAMTKDALQTKHKKAKAKKEGQGNRKQVAADQF